MNKTLLALALAAAWGAVQAAAVTDGSMGAVQSLSGNFVVPQALGTLKGGNLFHSFGTFSIGSSESATFLSTAGVNNVIARVTGPQASLLQGSLSLKAAGAARPDFFLINPNGITVSAGAAFDVPAGLHISTAPQLRFADGGTWSTGSTSPSTLSVAAPQRFGFLGGANAAAMTWQGANLTLASGSTLELAAGTLALDHALLIAPGGQIKVNVPGTLQIGAGGVLAATAGSPSGVGTISVDAGTLSITGSAQLRSGLIAQTGELAQGGGITVNVAGALSLVQGAEISGASASAVGGGGVSVRAGSLSVDSRGLFTTLNTASFGSGTGAPLTVDLSGPLTMNGGDISSTASGSGPGGNLRVSAASLRLGAGGGINAYGPSGPAGAIDVISPGTIELGAGASIQSSNSSTLAPGDVTVNARSVILDGADATGVASIASLATHGGVGASLGVVASDRITLLGGGQISAGSLGGQSAGSVFVSAPTVTLQGSVGEGKFVTGIYSTALDGNSGSGGTILVDAGSLQVLGTARIAANSLSDTGPAGTVLVTAGQLLIDAQGQAGGIGSFAFGSTNDAGGVVIAVSGELAVKSGGAIIAGTLGTGSSAPIAIKAGSVLIDGRDAPNTFTGIGADALTLEDRNLGAGAPVTVQATRVDIVRGGGISSSTANAHDAGTVFVKADTITIDAIGTDASTGIHADSLSAGRAGSITIQATDVNVLNNGLITSATLAGGQGGAIAIDATRVTIADGGFLASVSAGSGNAGLIQLNASEALNLLNGGVIAASSGGSGAAGRINIHAGSFTARGADAQGARSRIASRALPDSSGDAGSIAITVDGAFTLGADSLLSIANDSRAAQPVASAPALVRVQAGSITLQGGEITGSAAVNADAGGVLLNTPGTLRMSDSLVQTTAHNGNGGPIGINAGGVVVLHNTAVTTSVDGVQGGDGGNIRIAGSALVLQSGFVQGNTVAAKASGGNVTIDVPLLVPDGSNVFIGGNRIAQFRADTPGFNVIQAAAPNGLAGTLDVTTPDLNLSGALAALTTARIDFGLLGRDVCQIGFDSSFTPLGRGALPESAASPLRLRER